MRVEVHPADTGGCGFYRMRLPGVTLRDRGYEVAVMETGGLRYTHNRTTGELIHVHTDADVLVVQRVGTEEFLRVIEHVQRQGIAVVMDIDDALHSCHPQNRAFKSWSPSHPGKYSWHHLDTAAQLVDLVTVTTEELADYYRRRGATVEVLPNRINDEWLLLDLPEKVDGVPDVSVGWAGTVATHPEDLTVTEGWVAKVMHERPDSLPFLVVGDGKYVPEHLGFTTEGEVKATGWVPMRDYPAWVSMFDIGLVPLTGSRFNRSKSALKMLEYAAVGVVPVASRTPDNLRVHRDGIGLIATYAEDWAEHVGALLDDPGLRTQMSVEGRAIAAEHGIQAHAHDWWQAWERAADLRAGGT